MDKYEMNQAEAKTLRRINAELEDLRLQLDPVTRAKLQKTINTRLLNIMNEMRDAP